MRQLEKNVEMGFEKLPEKEKEKMRLEEKRKAEDELKSTQEDLWKLKSREKKIVTSETAARIKKINELGEKAKRIAEILTEEKKRIEEEKKLQEERAKMKRNREIARKEKLEKIETLQRRWALLRLSTEYIAENKKRWDIERKERELERNRKIEEWDKKNRHEKIKFLKRKWEKKPSEEQEQKENVDEKKTWQVWRSRSTEKKTGDKKILVEMPEKESQEKKSTEKFFPIFKELKKPKIIIDEKKAEEGGGGYQYPLANTKMQKK